MSYFVDTSAWYAFLDKADAQHERATNILGIDEEFVITDHVLVETHRLAEFRLGAAVADRFWEAAQRGAVTVEPVGIADLGAAFDIRTSWGDQRFSLVDCTSFAVMQRLRLRDVVAFDDDYAIYRFGSRRQHSFNLVR